MASWNLSMGSSVPILPYHKSSHLFVRDYLSWLSPHWTYILWWSFGQWYATCWMTQASTRSFSSCRTLIFLSRGPQFHFKTTFFFFINLHGKKIFLQIFKQGISVMTISDNHVFAFPNTEQGNSIHHTATGLPWLIHLRGGTSSLVSESPSVVSQLWWVG